jgi:hypothetical protein
MSFGLAIGRQTRGRISEAVSRCFGHEVLTAFVYAADLYYTGGVYFRAAHSMLLEVLGYFR